MSRFIAIEGLDGVGKSTAVKRLADYMGGHAMSTPGPALAGHRAAILESFAGDELAKALFYAASVSCAGRQARHLVKCGEWVFMDRYWASTLAYARARGVRADLEALGKSLVKPDITVLLLLDEPERQRRLQARGSTPEDNETLDPVFRQQVHEILHSLADFKIDITGLTAVETQALLSKTVKRIG